jgi:glycosyltransferase involved in cell wall biosynthesis
MFRLDLPAFAYSDPWLRPVEDRIVEMTRGSMRILYLYEAPDSSTFRYRVFNMHEAWRKVEGVSSSYFFYHELPRLKNLSISVDILVICRCRYSHDLAEFVEIQRSDGARVYFDIDDFVFSPPHVHLLVNTLAQDLSHPGIWDFWHAYTSRIREAMRMCDGAITTTGYLRARIEADLDMRTVIIPNALNSRQLEASDAVYEEKLRNDFGRAVNFQLGYFSGTPSHEKDFQLVENALTAVMTRHPQVNLRVVGYLGDRDLFRRFKGRIEQYPLHDFVNLQRIIGYSEVNLVPLQDNIFTNCKSELKFFEAAVVGTPTVATPIYSYAAAIDQGNTGCLAFAHEWEEHLESLITNEALLIDMAKRAHDSARSIYRPDAQTLIMQKAFFGDSGLERTAGR